MDTNILKYQAFTKTVESGSFTRAAELLGYSQSGISRMIRDLEIEWNVSLLQRGRSGVRLTSDGVILLPHAKRVLEEYQNLLVQVNELHGLESGLIRIGTFSSVATHWLPNIIKEFQKDYPNIDYELLLGDYTEIETWIREGRVDCGFLRLPAPRIWKPSFWNRTNCLLFFQKITHWRLVNVFRSKNWKNILSCFWKKGGKQKSRKFLNGMTLSPTCILRRGMIMP